MKVVEEEGTPIRDFLVYLKSEYLDAVYLQQDAFDPVDSACSADRQKLFFQFVTRVLRADLNFEEKNPARQFFHALAQATRDWNRMPMDGADFKKQEEKLNSMLAEVTKNA
jgi:V/A-type H+-transporting ATPase subunit A